MSSKKGQYGEIGSYPATPCGDVAAGLGSPIGYSQARIILWNDRGGAAPLVDRDVESELPGRTVKNYFVGMADEQKARYDEYSRKAAQLIKLAQARPLRREEFDRLMTYLACIRMICDTPAILDPTCRISPKLEELERVLSELLEEPERKVIVFSEWERMLDLVRERARELGVETAWHTGSVPQQRRRAEITRFKEDPACRLFLSTDSGSVGLNLQVASAVVNVDLPLGVGGKSGVRGLDRAWHHASAGCQAGAGRWRARRPRRSRQAGDAVGPRRLDRAHEGRHAGGRGEPAHRAGGRGDRRGPGEPPPRARAPGRGARARRRRRADAGGGPGARRGGRGRAAGGGMAQGAPAVEVKPGDCVGPQASMLQRVEGPARADRRTVSDPPADTFANPHSRPALARREVEHGVDRSLPTDTTRSPPTETSTRSGAHLARDRHADPDKAAQRHSPNGLHPWRRRRGHERKCQQNRMPLSAPKAKAHGDPTDHARDDVARAKGTTTHGGADGLARGLVAEKRSTA
jgi:hypothetical protein